MLKGPHNIKIQVDLFEELIARVQANTDSTPISIRHQEEFFDAVGSLLTATPSYELQKCMLRFLQVYFKSLEKLKLKKSHNEILNATFDQVDTNLNNNLVPYLIELTASSKIQLKQLSIDLIYSYMKLTENMNNLFMKFVKYGIENTDYTISKSFMDPTLCIMLTDDFKTRDFTHLVKSLVKQLGNSMFESSAIKCLNKIEQLVKYDNFHFYINKLSQNLKEIYISYKAQNNNAVCIFFKTF